MNTKGAIRSQEDEDDEDDDGKQSNSKVKSIFFAEPDLIDFDFLLGRGATGELIKQNMDLEEVKESVATISSNNGGGIFRMKTIDFIVMVGFHHKVGSQVEFIYPPLSEDINADLSVDFLKQIPLLALPDGSHITEVRNFPHSLCNLNRVAQLTSF